MNKKRAIIIVLLMLLVILIGGIFAYFTDTKTLTNVFTIGDNIVINLTEPNWVANGANSANGAHPGANIAKDPTITNESTTTPAYVFAEVTVPCYASTGTTVDTPLFTLNNIGSGWNLMSTSTVDTTNKTITYVYNYGTASSMTPLAASTSTAPVFDSVTLAPTLTAAQKATLPSNTDVVVNGYGIQTDNLGVSTPSAIFNLFTNP